MPMEGNNTKEGDVLQEGEGILVKKQHVAMGMNVLECPMCSTPLSPPIFQVMECNWCSAAGYFTLNSLCWSPYVDTVIFYAIRSISEPCSVNC